MWGMLALWNDRPGGTDDLYSVRPMARLNPGLSGTVLANHPQPEDATNGGGEALRGVPTGRDRTSGGVCAQAGLGSAPPCRQGGIRMPYEPPADPRQHR